MKKLLRKITSVLVAAGLIFPAGTEMFGLNFGTAIVASSDFSGFFGENDSLYWYWSWHFYDVQESALIILGIGSMLDWKKCF